MTTVSTVMLIAGIVSLMILVHYLDARYHWRLNDWINGSCRNPFGDALASPAQRLLEDKDQQIARLVERVNTLEAIVTEPAYELNKKINALK